MKKRFLCSVAFLSILSGCSSNLGMTQQKELLKSSAFECATSLSSMDLAIATNSNSGAITIKILNGSPKVEVITKKSVTRMDDLDGLEIMIAESQKADNGTPKSAWIDCMRQKGFVISNI